MNTSRQELQDYLSTYFPHMRIDTEHTLAGQITIKFNTTEDDSSEAEDRVCQAVERGALIFRALFEQTIAPLWILAYEYEDDNMFEYDSSFLFQQFMPEAAKDFVTNVEEVNSRMISVNKNGEEELEKAEATVTIGKVVFQRINIEAILQGIANKDNGLEPLIGQSVYFFDPINHTAFHMYDDRGFFVWANDAETIRPIYNTYNHWIPDYTKEDIDEFFN